MTSRNRDKLTISRKQLESNCILPLHLLSSNLYLHIKLMPRSREIDSWRDPDELLLNRTGYIVGGLNRDFVVSPFLGGMGWKDILRNQVSEM